MIVIQDNTINNVYGYFFSDLGGWIIGIIVSAAYVAGTLGRRAYRAAARHPDPRPGPARRQADRHPRDHASRPSTSPTRTAAFRSRSCSSSSMLLVLTFLAKRTTFGRHVYAVGGNAEAARRAGINVPRIRILVFMISGFMAGLGGIILAAAPPERRPERGRRHAADRRDRGGGDRRHEPVRRPRRGAERADRRRPDRDDRERDEHARLRERDHLHRDRLDPPARRHVRHDRRAGSRSGPGASRSATVTSRSAGRPRSDRRPSGQRTSSVERPSSPCRARSGRAGPRTRGSSSRRATSWTSRRAVREDDGDDRARGERRQAHLEPVARCRRSSGAASASRRPS